MKSWKIITAITLAVVAAALIAGSAFAYIITPSAYGTTVGASSSYGYYGGGMMGGRGMMGGYGYNYGSPSTGTTVPVTPAQPTQPSTPAITAPITPAYPGTYYNGRGCGGMGGFYGTPTTIYPTNTTSTATQLNITAALNIAQNYITQTGNTNLAVSQVEEYANNFYVQINEKNTGVGAFEMLINKYTGTITAEPGPNMMWNTKYGMMNGGMMSIFFTAPTTTMPVNATTAQADAQQYLNTYLPGTTTGDVTTFYGYYTIEILNGNSVYGMLSVNGYSGQVWYHTWHGAFIQELTI
jgi:hypothetical protein